MDNFSDKTTPHSAFLPAKEIRRNQAIKFINWLQFSLMSGLLEFNTPNALVHINGEGRLQISRKLFLATGYLELLKLYPIGFYSQGFRRNPLEAIISCLEEFSYLKRSDSVVLFLPHYEFFGLSHEQISNTQA